MRERFHHIIEKESKVISRNILMKRQSTKVDAGKNHSLPRFNSSDTISMEESGEVSPSNFDNKVLLATVEV